MSLKVIIEYFSTELLGKKSLNDSNSFNIGFDWSKITWTPQVPYSYKNWTKDELGRRINFEQKSTLRKSYLNEIFWAILVRSLKGKDKLILRFWSMVFSWPLESFKVNDSDWECVEKRERWRDGVFVRHIEMFTHR